jgi:hypothetical protein
LTIVGPVTRGPLRFAYLDQLASRFARAPVKMLFVDPQLITGFMQDRHYGSGPGQPVEGTAGMHIWMHYCWGRPYGQFAFGQVGDFRPMFPRVFDANFHALNIECGDCLGPEMELLEQVPADRAVAIGVLNHRVLQVETAEQIADKIRRTLKHIAPERLYLTSHSGLGTTLPRTIAFYKLQALADGAKLVRAELTGQREDQSQPASVG